MILVYAKKADISIIIVNYKVQKELFKCIDSIYKTCTDISFEIIVVDNDEVKTLQSPLVKKFPKVIYVPSSKNVGWGSGINIGAKYAKGNISIFLIQILFFCRMRLSCFLISRKKIPSWVSSHHV